jgi:alkaline phosphatase D
MGNTVDRRTALGLIAASGAVACATPEQAAPSSAPGTVFRYGVASGDPGADSIVLWTHVTATGGDVRVQWQLSEDAGFARIVKQDWALARAQGDHTVKVLVTGLAPGRTYFYRFQALEALSVVGRTRTLPVGHVERLGVAVVSCSNYAFGHFNAYDAIAKDPAVDIVLHTGDYIYEYGAGEWGDDVGEALGRRHQPPHEIVSLSDYRIRHAQYRSDPGAMAMFAMHPFVACWDDHEVTNNPWMNGAQNHQPDTEGDYQVRRAGALQAYYEWLPIRDVGMAGGSDRREEFWRTYVFGDLATLITLESRHTGRDEQVSYREHFDRIRTAEDRDAFMRDVIGASDRRMISARMEAHLSASLRGSVAAGQPWRLIGNASPIARMLVPSAIATEVDPTRRRGFSTEAAPEPDLLWTARWNLPFYTDTWDGYPVAREALYRLAHDAGAQDLIFLTGDSHSFWMNELFDASGARMGLELGTAGVTSPGDFVESGWDQETALRLDRLFERELPEVVWTDNFNQGYVRLDLTPSAARAVFVAVDTVLTGDYRARTLKQTQIVRTGGNVNYG